MTATPDQHAIAVKSTPSATGSLVQAQRDALIRLADEVTRYRQDKMAAEDEHADRAAWLDRRRDETGERARDRNQRRSKAAQRHAQAQLEGLQESHDAERKRFQRNAKAQREAIASETAERQKKVTADLEYERWTAGSIFEGTIGRLKQWLKDQQRTAADAEQGFRKLTVKSQRLLTQYRMPEPAVSLNTALAARATPNSAAATAAADAATPGVRPRASDDAEFDGDGTADHAALTEPTYPAAFDPQRPGAWYERVALQLTEAQRDLARMPLPRAFVGELPWVLATLFVIAGAFTGLLLPERYGQTELGPPVRILIAGSVLLFLAIGIWWLLFRMARRAVARSVAGIHELNAEFLDALRAFEVWFSYEHARRLAEARTTRDAALQQAESTFAPVIEELRQRRKARLDVLDAALETQQRALAEKHEANAAALRKRIDADLQSRQERAARRTEITRQRHGRGIDALAEQHRGRLSEIELRWNRQRDEALKTIADIEAQAHRDAPAWQDFRPPSQPASLAPFGTMRCEPRYLLHLEHADPEALGLPGALELSAALSMPGPRSWLIEAEPADRAVALSAMRSLILRLLTTQPPGQVRMTLLDPVGLGESFAGLMHLADYDERLVNARVWSEPAQMEQRLVDLTDHMSMVIQKYLRNDFETIEAYNAQAGELAEPYRFLIMADFPHGLSEDGLARLASIASSGARCGVFILLLRDPRKPLLRALDEDIQRHCVAVRRDRLKPGNVGGWRIRDDVFAEFPLTLDQAPDDGLFSKLIHRIGVAAVDAERVQVPFTSITPTEAQRWSADSAEELSVPIGRTGATRLQKFTLGHGVEQHALIAGKTGSGKSSLLHALVTNLALWYPPDQLELYLIDFKKGVEFKPYVTHRLPHARAIAIESDRAFGLSILRELDRLMDQRGEQFRDAGVQVLAQFRRARPSEPMPRVLLVVDEFQELFSRDDQIAQDAALLLDRLVRQGRAFGVHALMGSQSLSGAAGLARGTMGQMAVRIALQCSEADSQLILSDENAAARLLNRPGEAIYNARGGDLEGNSVFQVAWLPDEQHVDALHSVNRLRESRGISPLPRAVFEGSAPALLAENAELQRMLSGTSQPPRVPQAFVGEPIAIEAPTAIRLAREPGAHALIVGGSADAVLPMFVASILSLAAQSSSQSARFVVLNGSSEPAHDAAFHALADQLPHDVDVVSPRDAAHRLVTLHTQMTRRLTEDHVHGPAVFVLVFGLQRFRDLRKQEDAYSFRSLDDDGPKPVAPDKALGELLRDGPALGFHLVAWSDRAASVDAVLDRRDLREIDSRILFQMSANDSAQIIDSTDANDLGGFRALLHREDRGTITRFRPYGPIDPAWLKQACLGVRNLWDGRDPDAGA